MKVDKNQANFQPAHLCRSRSLSRYLCAAITSSRAITRVVLLILLFFLLSQTISVWSDENAAMAQQTNVQDMPSQHFLIDSIAAVVNGNVITISQLFRTLRWKKILEPQLYDHQDDQSSIKVILETYIDQTLLVQEINRTQFLTVPKYVIDTRFTEYAKQFGSEQDFVTMLSTIGFSREEFYLYLWRESMINRYAHQKFGSRIQMKDSEILEYLHQHYGEYGLSQAALEQPESIRVQPVWEQAERDLFQKRLKTVIREKLDQMRAQAEIRIFFPGPSAPPDEARQESVPGLESDEKAQINQDH
ncbi:hypothetical protein JXQ70_12885 [bacterium]|nr:hypothetical protein [bacterium]